MIAQMDLKQLLPSWYEGIRETDLLMTIENGLLEKLAEQIKKVQDNQYISTADSQTISIYEEMLGITPTAGDTLDLRRFRILTRMTTQKPYTVKYLKELLSSFGEPADLTMFYNEYRLLVEMNFEKYGQVTEVDYLFKSIVPANILVDIRNELKSDMPTNMLYAGASMTVTEHVTISQDFSGTVDVRGVISQAVGQVITVTETTGQDINQETPIQSSQASASGMVINEVIEIK